MARRQLRLPWRLFGPIVAPLTFGSTSIASGDTIEVMGYFDLVVDPGTLQVQLSSVPTTNTLVVNCATNKTVPCGTAWSFDAPTAYYACCSSNVTITPAGTVTNSGPCPWSSPEPGLSPTVAATATRAARR